MHWLFWDSWQYVTREWMALLNPSLFHSRCQLILHLIHPQQFKHSHTLFTQPAWPPWRLLAWFRVSIAPSDLHFLLSHPIHLRRSWFPLIVHTPLRVTTSLNDNPSCYGDSLDGSNQMWEIISIGWSGFSTFDVFVCMSVFVLVHVWSVKPFKAF